MQLPNVQFPPSDWPGGRYSFLLISLLLLFAISPVLPESWIARTIFDVFTAVVFVSGVMSQGNRFVWIIGAVIFIPEIIGTSLGWALESGNTLGGGAGGTLRSVSVMLFCGYMIVNIMRDVAAGKRISGDAICGALSVYLLLGLLWTFAYLLIAHYVPESFSFNDEIVAITSPEDSRDVFSLMVYFSFVTLTTLGFGDITPVSPIARTACWMEAIVGQLFLATIVAGMVGMHIAERIERDRIEREEK